MSLIPCIFPALREELDSNAFSKGPTNVPNKSNTFGELVAIIDRISGSVKVLKTMGSSPSALVCSMILDTAFFAEATSVTNGIKVLLNWIFGNWVRRLPPRVSAVMPVLSEIKKTFLLIKMRLPF